MNDSYSYKPMREIDMTPAPLMTGWQPIETAPKDGTIIDLWAVSKHKKEGLRVAGCWWSIDMKGFPIRRKKIWVGFPYDPMKWEPTHWMPEPAPPSN